MGEPVPPGSPGATIVAEEERLFAQVSARVAVGEEGDARPTIGASDLDQDLLSLRDQIAEARAEDLPPLIEQMTRLAALRARLGGGKSLPVDLNCPYFAHMRLRQNGASRDVLVGKRGFIDRTSGVQIVDWRNAPVSRVYYRYEEGDDYEEEIAGRAVEGLVEVRRNVSIHQGKLRRIGAPQGTFIRSSRGEWTQAVGQLAPTLHGGVGKAARPVAASGKGGRLGVHSGPQARADKGLPEIAALIDKEQFDLITQPDSGIVVIQGGAGSGKTTVALHRIAYLNFNDTSRFRPNQMLFVVPSMSLVRYVAGVLPALGVNGVPVVTYTGWARTTRMKCVPDSPVKYNAEPPDNVSRVKKHPGMMSVFEKVVAAQVEAATAAVDEVGDAGASAEWRRVSARALVPRLRGLMAWLKKSDVEGQRRFALEGVIKKLRRRADDVVADWAEVLTDRVLLGGALLGAGCGGVGEGQVTHRDIDATVKWVKRQLTAPQGPVVDGEGNAVVSADGRQMGGDDDDPAGRIDDEDDPLLLRLVQLKRGGLITPDGDEFSYQHIAVDEAQDRSALEVKVLTEAAVAPPGKPELRSITIAGDTAQRLVFDNNFTGWSDLLAQLGQPAIVRPLRLSYRSTAEVMLLAREILGPELAPSDPLVARSGEPVELHEFGDVGEAVAFLADSLRGLLAREPGASCAVISRHPEQADVYFDGLRRADVPALRRVKRDEFSFQPGVDVTDAAQVKGLEFDYVVMVDVNEAGYPNVAWARHLLHIGVTRAAHQLWLVATGEPSPLLPSALRDSGRMSVG